MIENFGYDSSKGLSVVLEKHGTHDQSSHGNWARGISLDPKVAASILNRVKENGGLSVNMVDGSEPTTGFMVAKGKQYGRIVKAEDFYDSERGPEILYQYMKANKSDLATGKNYLGLWHNTEDNQVYLDVSENIQDRERATSAGRERDQISIWDVVNFAEIDTGGTGSVGKQRNQSGGNQSKYRGDDGRGITGVRQGSLGEDGKAQVIRFAFGLKPVFKHEGGGHDQSTHGNWAKAGYTESEAEGISRYENLGPTTQDLDNILDGVSMADYDTLSEFVLNDGDQYELMVEYGDLESRVADAIAKRESILGREISAQERADIYAAEQAYAVKNYVLENETDINNIRNEQLGLKDDPTEFLPSFNDVYGIEFDATLSDGTEVRMSTEMESIDVTTDGIFLEGSVTADGMQIGRVERVLFRENGVWNVEHKWFDVEDEYQGTGFGKAFLKQQEDYYTAKGFGYIKIMAGLEDGARHWARAGFDFNPQYLSNGLRSLKMSAESRLSSSDLEKFMEIYDRGFDSASGRVKDYRADDFPFPAEFANLGWENRQVVGGEYQWAGKTLMINMVQEYVKPLTAEGRNLLSGPIDRDGDGLVYDGTMRERPAPNK